MAQAMLAERVGRVLKGVKGPNGADAKIVRSVLMKEVFPANPGIEVLFDFYVDEHGQRAVHLTRRGGSRKEPSNHWTLSAIENRDAAGLEGFIGFAETLGLKGANLANIICGLKPR